jgi:hypothetical protein
MATQKVIVELDHSAKVFLAQLVKDVAREAGKPTYASGCIVQPPASDLEGVSIDTPEGTRYLWLDETGESHWLGPSQKAKAAAAALGWRQALVRSGQTDLVAAPDPEGPQEKAATVRLGVLRTAVLELAAKLGSGKYVDGMMGIDVEDLAQQLQNLARAK